MSGVLPSFFYDRPPAIVQDSPETTTSGTLARIVSPTPRRVSSKAHQEVTEEASAEHSAELASIGQPTYAALELSPTQNKTKPKEVSRGFGDNLLFHASKMAEMMEILNGQRPAPNLTAPHWESKDFNVTQASNDSIVYAKDEVSLTKESSRFHQSRREKLHARRQITTGYNL